jgi:hypothetical protein
MVAGVLTEAAAHTMVGLTGVADFTAAAKAEEDSTAVVAGTSAERVFGAGGQLHHGKRVVGRTEDLVDGALVGAAIPRTSEGARLG